MPSAQTFSSILDPIQVELSPYIFDEPQTEYPHLKPRLREWILDQVHSSAEDFRSNPSEWMSPFLTGSLCTYQYGPHSDCDINIFVNHDALPEWDRAKLIGAFMSTIDGHMLPGTPYPLQIFIIPADITPELKFQPGLRAGYDLDHDVWVSAPERSLSHDVQVERSNIYINALETADKMESLIKYEPIKALEYYRQLHHRRKRQIEEGKGELAPANIIYKLLDKKGLFKEINEIAMEDI